MCWKNSKTDTDSVNIWLLRVSAPTSHMEEQSHAHTSVLWLFSLVCSSRLDSIPDPRTVLQRKGPQSTRPLYNSLGGATLTTAQLHLTHTHWLATFKSNQSTVALLLCCVAFYIMCASGPFRCGLFWQQPLHDKEKRWLVSSGLDCQLIAALTLIQTCYAQLIFNLKSHFQTYTVKRKKKKIRFANLIKPVLCL